MFKDSSSRSELHDVLSISPFIMTLPAQQSKRTNEKVGQQRLSNSGAFRAQRASSSFMPEKSIPAQPRAQPNTPNALLLDPNYQSASARIHFEALRIDMSEYGGIEIQKEPIPMLPDVSLKTDQQDLISDLPKCGS